MIYEGYLGNYYKLSPEVRQGYATWVAQKGRCRNKNNSSYHLYGAKGIDVQYSSREFLGWWLQKLKSFNGLVPTVERIDETKDFTLDNIQMVEQVYYQTKKRLMREAHAST